MADAVLTRRAMLRAIPATPLLAAPLIGAAQAIEMDHPDRGLLLLNETLEAEQAKYELVQAQCLGLDDKDADDRLDGAHQRCARVINAIEGMQAKTLDGLRVKARAVQWCQCGDAIELGGSEASDVRLAAQIINSLLEF